MKSPAFSYKDRELKGLISEVNILLSSLQVKKKGKGGLLQSLQDNQSKRPKVSMKAILTQLMHRKIGDPTKLSWEELIMLVTYNKSTLNVKKKEKKEARDAVLSGFNHKEKWPKFQYLYYVIFAKTFYIKGDVVNNYFRYISSIIHIFGYDNIHLYIF